MALSLISTNVSSVAPSPPHLNINSYGQDVGIMYPDYTQLVLADSLTNNVDFYQSINVNNSSINHDYETHLEHIYSNPDILSDVPINYPSGTIDKTVGFIYQILNHIPTTLASSTEHSSTESTQYLLSDNLWTKNHSVVSNPLSSNEFGDIDRTPTIPFIEEETNVTAVDNLVTTVAPINSPVEYTTFLSLVNSFLLYFGSNVTTMVGYIDCVSGGLLTALVSGVLMFYNLLIAGTSMYFGRPVARAVDVDWVLDQLWGGDWEWRGSCGRSLNLWIWSPDHLKQAGDQQSWVDVGARHVEHWDYDWY